MPNWSKMILTEQGKNCLASIQLEKSSLILKSVVLGSGVYSGTENKEKLKKLVKEEQFLDISYKKDLGNGVYKIIANAENTHVKEGYYIRELGVIAHTDKLGDFLFSITTDDSPDFMPAYGGSNVVSNEFAIYIHVGSSENVVAKFEDNVYATITYVDSKVDEHAKDPKAHKSIFESVKEWVKEVFATKENVEENKSYSESTYLKKTEANETYLKKLNAKNNYITKTEASDIYTRKDYAETEYLKKADAEQAYQPKLKFKDKMLDVLGVKYSIDTNGYICFGPLFGGLIIQWGTTPATEYYNPSLSAFPITFPTKAYGIVANLTHGSDSNNWSANIKDNARYWVYSDGRPNDCHWIAVGR